jgi:hypothetical protein
MDEFESLNHSKWECKYHVFGFIKQALCVQECPQVNNATYVMPMDSWGGHFSNVQGRDPEQQCSQSTHRSYAFVVCLP